MSTKVARQIIHIDEDRCNGCGQCVTACAEGALAIIDGKARLINEVFCDGLGACIGECPTGALLIEQRTADEFDEEAVERHLAQATVSSREPLPCDCPGSLAEELRPRRAYAEAAPTAAVASELRNWPVQIHLLPLEAPYYAGADLLLAADCVPFAHPAFHHDLLRGRTLAVGCPKLDDAGFYVEKLAGILRANDIRSLTVAHMEVPCCFGLQRVAETAVAQSGKSIPVETTVIGRDGTVKSAPDRGAACPHA
ncbi:MAG TPA: 4Fe-4S binding protein [Armatimonadota bacterium]|nr:4Fe-4S binding protein [Armatimonadota bacterium]